MTSPPRDDAASTQLLTIDFRSGEPVREHPALEAWITDGWSIKSACPRVTDDGLKLLVVLTNSAPNSPSTDGPSTDGKGSHADTRGPIRRPLHHTSPSAPTPRRKES